MQLYSTVPCNNLQARGAVHYQHQNPLDNQQESTCTINAYINIKMTKKSAELSCSVFFEVGLSDLKLYLPVGNCSNQSEMELENKQELQSRLLGMDGWHRFYAFKIHLEVFIN